MISQHLDTGSTEVFQNERAQKRTIHNLLSLSEDVTVTLSLSHLTGAWLYRGSCLHEEIIENLILAFVGHNDLILLHLFPSKDLEF